LSLQPPISDMYTAPGDIPLTSYRADLHIHTAASPCAATDMTPSAIIAAAHEAGLDVIAIADHNTTSNVAAVQAAAIAADAGMTVLPGMEIASAEEAHILGIFPDLQSADDAAAEFQGLHPHASSHLDVVATVALVHSRGGLAIAAHVDRGAFSVLSQLGHFPREARFDGVEVSRRIPSGASQLERYAAFGLPLVGSSDSHFLDEIGTMHTELVLAEPSHTELMLAFAGKRGRSVSRA